MRNTLVSATVLVVICMAPLCLASGRRELGNVSAVTVLPNGVELRAGDATVRITALSPSVVRLRYAPSGTFPPEHSFAVAQTGFTPPVVRVADSPAAVEFRTSKFNVRVEKSSVRVSFLDPAGGVILEDDPQRPVCWVGSEFRVWKLMPHDEHYFGLGGKPGPIDHRDQAFTNWNRDAFGWEESTDPLYTSIPFFLGVRGGSAYGIFLDNTYRSSFDFGKELHDVYSFGAEGGELDYYFVYGPHPKQVVQDYTALTGRIPLPPLFALGYQQSRYTYYPEGRVREIANEFRRRKIPADVIYLDIDYEDHYRSFTINHKYFPNFADMVRGLGQQGFKVVAIVDPHLKRQKGYKPYDEAARGDHLVKNPDGSAYEGKVWPGKCVFPDFLRTSTRAWFGQLYAEFAGMGIRGFWNDMNEPTVFGVPGSTMPLDVVHDVDGRRAEHREVHNVYGMENARATYEGLLHLQPELRPLVLTRAGFAGTQRYAAAWTGDNESTWNHFRMSVTTLLSFGVSGYAFVGDDVGGFDGSPTPELLTRWIELGAFYPFYRNHTSVGTLDQEPWVHGPEHEAIRRQYIETRYRLLPYLYTSMEETSRTGVPVMRPMFLEFPGDARLATIDTEFMFGADLLVAPKVKEKVDPYEVVLPAGGWFDYWTGQQVPSRERLKLNPPLSTLPIYVRAGAIIPQQPVVQSTDEVPRGPLELRVYPGPDCRGSVYADDGNTFAYRRGEFSRTSFTCEVAHRSIAVHVAAPEGHHRPWWTAFNIVVFGAESRPRRVTVADQPASGWNFDATAGIVSLIVPAEAAPTNIVVEY